MILEIEFLVTANYDYGDHVEQISTRICDESLGMAKITASQQFPNADWIKVQTWENDLNKFGGLKTNL